MFSHPVTRIISLHSILVKSILHIMKNNDSYVKTLHSILVKSILATNLKMKKSKLTLHSILVKSIRPESEPDNADF